MENNPNENEDVSPYRILHGCDIRAVYIGDIVAIASYDYSYENNVKYIFGNNLRKPSNIIFLREGNPQELTTTESSSRYDSLGILCKIYELRNKQNSLKFCIRNSNARNFKKIAAIAKKEWEEVKNNINTLKFPDEDNYLPYCDPSTNINPIIKKLDKEKIKETDEKLNKWNADLLLGEIIAQKSVL